MMPEVLWQQTSVETAGCEPGERNLCGDVFDRPRRSWSREDTKLVGSVVNEKWNQQRVDSPRIARDAVWQRRKTRC